MASYKHSRQHRFHTLRYGFEHWTWHQDGVKHPHRRKRKRKKRKVELPNRRYVLVVSGIFIALLLALAAQGIYAIYQARGELSTAQSKLETIVHDPNILLTPRGRAQAIAAVDEMAIASSRASHDIHSSIGLDVYGVLPYIGTQIDAVTRLVDDVNLTSNQGSVLITEVNELAASSYGTHISLPQLNVLARQTALSTLALRNLNHASAGLIGPLAAAQDRFNRVNYQVTYLLDRGTKLLAYAKPFLGEYGPRNYFVAGENNAEMRDQGAVLSFALLTTHQGNFDMNHAQSVGNIMLSSPAPVDIGPGAQQVFGPLFPTMVWQSTNAWGDFPLSGKVMSAMYAQATSGHVDGVIGVDVIALQKLLQLTGPVVVPEIPIPVSSGNVVNVLLHRLYINNHSPSQDVRHDQIAAVAQAAIKKMNVRHVDVARLLNTLAKLEQGRHILLWDSVPKYQAVVSSFGGSGSLDRFYPASAFHLAVESGVAAKLDYYIHTYSTMHVKIDAQGNAQIETVVAIKNTAPAGQGPSYQLGPDHVNSFVPGQYVSRIYLWSPRGSIAPGGVNEGGLVLQNTIASVMPGHTAFVRFQTVMLNAVHNNMFTMYLIPQPLLYPTVTSISIDAPQWHLAGPQKTTVIMSRERLLHFSL